jgi:CpXC protein
MSLFADVVLICGRCKAETKVALSASVNADRRPDLRAAILDGSFQALHCPSCDAPIRLPSRTTYIDMGRGQWIMVDEFAHLNDWRTIEGEATALFAGSFGAKAPPAQRSLGEALTPRLAFGWPALREKLIAAEAGLDDTVLELTKIAVLRNVPDSPLQDDNELRLIAASDDDLTLRWVESATERPLFDLPLKRTIYDDIASHPDPWAQLAARLHEGLFVDMARMFRA